MKTRSRTTKVLTIAIALAALAAVGWLQPVKAQTGDGSVRFVTYASVGIIPDERIRLSMGNPKNSAGTIMLSYSFYLAHGNISSSTPLYESELIKVPAGEFRYVDVRRKNLNTEGELPTGRAQMIVRTTIIAPAGSNPDDFAGSLEVLEDEVQDGNTVPLDSKYRLVILAARRSKQVNAPIALLPGQSLRFTFLYPDEEGSEPVSVTTFTYDGIGRLTSQSTPVKLEPGECHTFVVNYDDLRVEGEKGTGRTQVGSGIQVLMTDGSVRSLNLPVWMELVNNQTGSTSGGGTYYAGSVTVSGDGF